MFSYLSSAFSALPFSSLAASSLSSALQNRILHYLLKRALGRIIKDGDLKLDQIEAGIVNGTVEIRNVHLNSDFINDALRQSPFRMDYGLVGSIFINIPWSNLWAGQLSIAIDDVDVALFIDGSHMSSDMSTSMSESILNVAEDVFEQDAEGREIEESIASLVDVSSDMEEQPPEASSQGWAAYVVSLVDGLIARLHVSTKNVRIRFKNQDQPANAPIDIQLRLDDLQLNPDEGDLTRNELSRLLTISGVSLWLDDRSSDDEVNDDDSSSAGSESYMQSSHADLRSTMTESMAESMYASAYGGDEDDGNASRRAIPLGPHIIARSVGESIDVRMKMMRTQVGSRNTLVNVSVGIQCGLGAILVTPDSLGAVLRFCQDASSTFTALSTDDGKAEARIKSSSTDYEADLQVTSKGCHLICAYEFASLMTPHSFMEYQESVENYWLRPGRNSPLAGHFRLRVQDFEARTMINRQGTQLSLQIGDMGFYEQLAVSWTTQKEVNSLLPILIFDKGLIEEEDEEKGNAHYATDWRAASIKGAEKSKSGMLFRKMDFSEQGWKVKSRNRRQSLPLGSPSVDPCIRLEGWLSKNPSREEEKEGVRIQSLPIHLFVDNTTVDRTLPLVHHLGLKARPQGKDKYGFDSMAASFETVHAHIPTSQSDDETVEKEQASILPIAFSCDLLRVQLRISATSNTNTMQEGPKNVSLRSGIMTLDFEAIEIAQKQHLRASKIEKHNLRGVHFESGNESPKLHDMNVSDKYEKDCNKSLKVSLRQIKAYFTDLESHQAHSIASIGSLGSEDHVDTPLPPTIEYRSFEGQESQDAQSIADCRLPLIEVTLSKHLLDRIELMADDLSLWYTNIQDWKVHSEVDNAAEALKILGSRFFGAKQSFSTLSSSSELTEIGARKANQKPLFALAIQEAEVKLLVGSSDNEKEVLLHSNDILIHFDAQHAANSTRTTVSIATIDVTHRQDSDGPKNVILKRTLQPSITRRAAPMLSVQITSTTEPGTSYRGSQIDLLAQNFTFVYDGNDAIVYDLLAFTRSPEGAFEHVQPSEMTKIAVQIKEASLEISPPKVPALAVVCIGNLSVRTKLISDYPRSSLRINLGETSLLLGEGVKADQEREVRARRSIELWTVRGLFKTVNVDDVRSTIVLSKLTRPEIDVKVSKMAVEILACADTLHLVQKLVEAFPKPTKPAKSKESGQRQAYTGTENIFSSIIEDTFRRAKGWNASVDLVDDDIPRHPAFLRESERGSKEDVMDAMLDEEFLDSADEEKGKRKNKTENKSAILLQNDVVAVRLLDTENGIAPSSNYFTDPNLIATDNSTSNGDQAPSLRFTVQDFDLVVRLFAGYDLVSTRTALEEEAKRVRRRLQKIQQMLDQGQVPDDSVEEAAASLFDSVHLPLPHGKAAVEMEAGELMKIVDDELDDGSESASSASTWKQFVPGRLSSSGSSTPTKRKRSKMARSKDSLIDIELKGIRLDHQEFRTKGDLSSRTDVQILKVRILDNVPTSTWQTFLTSLAANTRDVRSSSNPKDMVRFEILNVLPTIEGDATEVRCKARISPLRLHVDQDALDFLKKFFTFELPKGRRSIDARNDDIPSPKTEKDEQGPFIQHADIYAIKLKLDYKPKRVDYRLLRQGKTIEMMNFFNFEGSAITLRHITLRGIMGWPKLFDTLNELWTPDVKSNQLADVLSGITPIRSLVNVGNGVADLILLPIEHYQRDGNFSRGFREGAKRFVKSTALEAARIGARLASGTQVILERAENVLGGDLSGREGTSTYVANMSREERDMAEEGSILISDEEEVEEGQAKKAKFSRFANQPNDLRQAIDEAQRGISKGFNEAAQTILAVPMEVYDRRAGEGGSKPVVRAVPIAILHSAAGTSEAISKTLQGVHRELSGVHLADDEEEKYKKPNRGASTSSRNTTSR
ncbi:uncharacterized protein FA14DRAFT_162592 [Meira miltonrushii]|uniref:Autophagy-related protein 2 n=1 Tax=Meira miltonrushii TaxID=1280837 RepID=A0A316V2B2_9BASI|nr:uncharacterized protein FA14DRAFT_162592 [Meira miltonrushii]PWN31650.1 hypothetical protein FA14DRAFT_162592 [Meira miltonrushii]